MKRKIDKHGVPFGSSPAPDDTNYDNPIAKVTVASLDYFIGQVFAHSELLGLNDRQITAYKSSLREMFWRWFNNHLPNESGLADPSYQARVSQGVEPFVTTSTGNQVYHGTIAK